MKNLGPPLLTLIVIVAAWYGLVLFFKVPGYLLPLPQTVAQRLGEDFFFLMHHGWVTTYETLGGFLLSIAFGIPLAVLVVSYPAIDKAVMPWLVLSQTFPKVALAPLIVVWFGLGVVPKLIVTFLVAFFPVLISTVAGLRSMERDMLELAQSMRCGKLKTFFFFRMPLAMPSVFAGLKVSVAFAVVGAVIAEWVGANEGLGYLLLVSNANLDTPLLFAVLVILLILGVALYYGLEALERVTIPWHAAIRLKDMQITT